MADRELANVLNSGEVTNYQKGGTDIGDKLLSSEEIDTKLLPYAKTDGTTPVSLMRWTPVDPTTVSYVESTTYYNQDTGTFDVKGKYPDVTLQTGREVHIEVVNNTGSTIINGTACRHNGVATGNVQIERAIADSFTNSRILGVATHDISNGETGIITSYGKVGGVDTSLVATGVPLYLSDTVAGTFTETAPDIVSQVGGSLVQDAVDGELFVSIDNTINLPSIGAFFQGLPDTTPVDGAYREFGNSTDFPQGFDLTESVFIDVSSGNSFVVPAQGIYSGSFVLSMSGINANNNGHVMEVQVYNKTTSQGFVYNAIVGRNDTVMSCSFSALVTLAANDEVVVRYRELTTNNMDGGGNITIDGIQFSIESQQLR